MKKFLIVAVIAASIIASAPPAQGGPPSNAPCLKRSWIPRTGMPTAEKEWRFIRLVDCAVRRWWPGAGHTRAALDVAWRESHYSTFAVNTTGCGGYGCLGAFQQHAKYWPGRRDAYLDPDWFRHWPVSWTNARSQVIVSVRMFAANDGPCPDWC